MSIVYDGTTLGWMGQATIYYAATNKAGRIAGDPRGLKLHLPPPLLSENESARGQPEAAGERVRGTGSRPVAPDPQVQSARAGQQQSGQEQQEDTYFDALPLAEGT